MNVIKIMGGLGNQMFQYAFSKCFEQKGGVVKFDTSYYSQIQCHNGFELSSVFPNINIIQTNLRDVFYFVDSHIENGEKIYMLKADRKIFSEFEEQEFSYIPELLSFENTYFTGYWQHEQYFKDYKSDLLNDFEFRVIDENDALNKQLCEDILSSNAVSIHIRRGDYLHSPIHLNISLDYYQNAISLIIQQISSPKFFIFSDDMDWVKQNLNITDPVFVNHNKGKDGYKDMQLMSYCKHNIIANSTFSWWAAWLNNNNSKIIISPQKWFIHGLDLSGLLLENWIKI